MREREAVWKSSALVKDDMLVEFSDASGMRVAYKTRKGN